MYLGVWWNPFSWGQDFIDGIVSFFYGILLTIDCIIYSFVSYVYQIFLVLAQGGEIFDDKIINGFVNRLYIILGVVMLFIIAYSLLKNMVNPDETLKGKKSPISIVKDVIISVVLIALVPTIFDFAFAFQNSLLINNTIGKIIVGEGGSGTTTDDIRKGGYIMASGVFKAFLHAEHPYCDSKNQENNGVYDDGTECKTLYVDNSETTTYGDLWNEAYDSTTFWALARLGPSIVSGNVSYYILIAPAAGVFVLLVLLNYCLDMALRLVKLAVYELIAPIPLFARMVPNDQAKKVFDNWLKATMSTFAEVFIRIAILYFSVMLISAATSSINNLFSPLVSGSARLDLLLFAQALIIIGIILFVKQAPEIIKEITGLDSGKFNVLGSAMKSAAMIGGAVTAGVNNWNDKLDENGKPKTSFNRFKSALGGAGSAAARSTWNRDNIKNFGDMFSNANKASSEAMKAHSQRAARNARYKANGQNALTGHWEDFKDAASKHFGFDQGREILEARKKIYDEAQGFQKQLFDLASDDKTVLALEGQKKAAAEKIIDRDAIRKELLEARKEQIRREAPAMTESQIADQLEYEREELENQVNQTLVERRKEQAATIDMYDNLIKVAKLKVIQEKMAKRDGRYLAVAETAKVFKSQHMDDPTIAKMEDIFITPEQAKQLEGVLDLTDPKAVERQMDIIKGKVVASDSDIIKGSIGVTADNEKLKMKSGETQVEIAKLVQKEKGKEAEKK
ncbi:MAG: hypothetical protein E7163_02805 [Firmicutes bacterium]|nr:hypothetical protein [Bacillota bacterium]